MSKLFTLFFLIMGYCDTVSSQALIMKTLDRNQYLSKVKLIDEFFARFNGQETRHDISSKYRDRESSVLLLFDLSKYKSESDSGFVTAKLFAKDVVADSTYINYEDGKWFARVKCTAHLIKKPTDFLIFLTIENVRDSVYKWVISNVDGDIFKTSRDNPHKELYISPNSHELFFSSLRNVTKDAYEFVDDYTRKSFKADQLSVFTTLVRSGQLKIDAISNLEFVFTQVPNYVFTVRHFERDSKNAGWLIDTLKVVSEEEKNNLIKEILQ